jgi:hypothetical protein
MDDMKRPRKTEAVAGFAGNKELFAAAVEKM